MTTPRRLVDRLPAPLSLRLRAERQVLRLRRLHNSADVIMGLVPRGRNAVDVGANRGVYTYWMSKRASRVDAFEPQPALVRYIRGAHLRNVHVHATALSDRAGTAQLHIPENDYLARIECSDPSDAIALTAESTLEVNTTVQVTTRTLDSFRLEDVGFLKIDVEGHELAVLHGAHELITASRPVIFVESEARHTPGAPAGIIELMRDEYGYRTAAFLRQWVRVDIAEFDLNRDQLRFLPDFRNPAYVSNFVFWP